MPWLIRAVALALAVSEFLAESAAVLQEAVSIYCIRIVM